MKKYDFIVLGAGAAGLTAAIYAGRYDMKTLVIGNNIGGTTNLAQEIENWPGFLGSGFDLMTKFKDQALMFGAELLEAQIDEVEKVKDEFIIHVDNRKIHAKTILVCLGSEHRRLNLPGEKDMIGKGVSYCATCDGNFFRGKEVTIVGGANSAAVAALYLAKICKKVDIIYRRHEMRCEPISLRKINATKNIKIHYHSNPTEIIGKEKVTGIKILTEEEGKKSVEKVLKTDGVFFEIGSTPVAEVIKNLDLKREKKYIKVDKTTATSLGGCYAAGDITNNTFKQTVTAAGEGAIAAKTAHEYLMLQKFDIK